MAEEQPIDFKNAAAVLLNLIDPSSPGIPYSEMSRAVLHCFDCDTVFMASSSSEHFCFQSSNDSASTSKIPGVAKATGVSISSQGSKKAKGKGFRARAKDEPKD